MISFPRLELMSATLLKYSRKEYYIAKIKDIIDQIDEYAAMHMPQADS